jgi:hypothetical protein
MNSFIRRPLATTVALLALAPVFQVFGQSAILPAPGQFEATPMYVYQSFKDFWMGKDKASLPDHIVQHTASVALEYGVTDTIALDTTVGYTWVDTTAFGGKTTDDGLTDTRIGVRWQVFDERATTCKWAPTVAFRLGGIIAGTYDTGLPVAPGRPCAGGDGAHGGEASMLFTKAIADTGFGLYGEVGYRLRENPVPDDFFGLFGAYKTFGSFTLNAAYRHVQGLSGTDIGAPGFTFPALKEINQIFEAGLGFRDSGGRYYQVFGAFNLGGRNTGDKTILGVSATFPF